ncbi:GNAT family N-acetyltransferase [Aspergillus tubingensis]|uniref:GNAT family N-acetyltransferase n=1 Tax=Aspergillus tubingensis TaxID=5068 RepID=UPI00157902CC|nr:acyl-CoA N-acyltransferase [Aspergillus tubingensis]GFN21210.1 acyl-CoA N-acyltransferase [Aspergillus tubingensis]GLA96051.1 hypothetical protein AtubIFM57143_003515 [Aspergillus tubingensis]GLB21280.1 hypothetical protein AtubIFM61612_011239 [Aspergillus tubingensis]
MTPPLTLHRVTTLQDLEPLYHIGADAFRDDPGINWFYPGGREHPEDFIVAWKYLLLQEFFDKGKYILAASIPDPDQDDTSIRVERRPGKVVGFAVWERRGVSEAAKSWQGGGVLKGLKRLLLNLQILYTFYFDTPRRSLSWPRLRHFGHELEAAKASQPSESWYLSNLAVSSTAQGQGVGKKLLQWGIDRSEEEGIPATLVSTDAGLHLYTSRGFRNSGWLFFDDGRQKQTVMRRNVKYVGLD